MASKGQKEFGRFSLVGLTASAIDYGILNVLVIILGLPLIASNIASTSISSYVSFMLNRKLVFKRQKYGSVPTILLYAATIAIGIFVIQSAVLYLLGNGMIEGFLRARGVSDMWASILGINIAKIAATTAAAGWNFYSLQRIVFISHDESKNS